MSNIYKTSSAGGFTSITRYPNMLTNYGDFGAVQRIAYTKLTSAQNVAFYSIPQTYQDLMIVSNVRGTSAGALDSLVTDWTYAAQYSNTYLKGSAGSATSTRDSSQYGALPVIPSGGSTAGYFGTVITHIFNYANTTYNKTAITQTIADANGTGQTQILATLRSNTGAVSFIEVGGATAVLAIGSTVALYGIKASDA